MPFYKLHYVGTWDDPDDRTYDVQVVTLAANIVGALDEVRDCVHNCQSEGDRIHYIGVKEVSEEDFLESNFCPVHTWVGS